MADDVVVIWARGTFERQRLLEQIGRVRKEHGVVVQAFDPGAIYGRRHVDAAVAKARRAHDEGRATANDLATEIACYAAGDIQIAKALERVGLPERGQACVVALVGAHAKEALEALLDASGLERDDGVIGEAPGTLDRVGIPAAMRDLVPEERWGDLVVEKVALVDAVK